MKYKINKGFIVEKIEGKTIIYDEKKSVLYTFNKKIKQGKEKEEIIELIIKRYNITKKRADKDVENLISELLKNKIVS